MGATAVIFESNANLTKIQSLHDQISNTLSSYLGKWSFEYKLFRENPASSGNSTGTPTSNSGTPGPSSSSFLYTIAFSQFPGELFCLTNGDGIITQGDFDSMLTTKLQSLWLPRQTIKAEGNGYELESGDFILRTANLFLQGSFRGLVVQIESTKATADDESSGVIAKINAVLKNYDMEYAKDSVTYTKMDSAWQFVQTISK